MESQVTSLNSQIQSLTKEKEASEKQLKTIINEKISLLQKIQKLEEKEADEIINDAKLRAEISKQEELISSLNRELEQLKESVLEDEEKDKDEEKEANWKNSEELEKEIDELKKEKSGFELQISVLQTTIRELGAQKESLK